MWPVSKCEKPHVTKKDLGLWWSVSWRFHWAHSFNGLPTQCPNKMHVLQPPPVCAGQGRAVGKPDLVAVIAEFWQSYSHTCILSTLNTENQQTNSGYVCVRPLHESTWAPKGRKEGHPNSKVRDITTHEQDYPVLSDKGEIPEENLRPLYQ